MIKIDKCFFSLCVCLCLFVSVHYDCASHPTNRKEKHSGNKIKNKLNSSTKCSYQSECNAMFLCFCSLFLLLFAHRWLSMSKNELSNVIMSLWRNFTNWNEILGLNSKLIKIFKFKFIKSELIKKVFFLVNRNEALFAFL